MDELLPLRTMEPEPNFDYIQPFLDAISKLLKETPPVLGRDKAIHENLEKWAQTDGRNLKCLFSELEDAPLLGLVSFLVHGDTSELITTLLNTAEVDVNEQFKDWMCAVHYAAQVGNVKTLRTLVARGANLGALDQDGWTPLHTVIACLKMYDNDSSRHLECLDYLLESLTEEQINVLDRHGHSAIYLAAQKGNLAAIDMMIRNEKAVFLQLDDLFGSNSKSARKAILDAFPMLKDRLPPPLPSEELDTSRLFQLLYSKEEIRFCKELQKLGPMNKELLNADNGRHTFLQLTCQSNLPTAVKLLLDLGADPNKKCPNTESPALICGKNGFYKSITYLLPEIEPTTFVSLLCAACKCSENLPGRIRIIRKLVADYKVNITSKDEDGKMALNYAQSNCQEVAEMLNGYLFIKKVLNNEKGDINERSKEKGLFAIHYAACHGFPDALKALRERGADMWVLDWNGRTALHTVVLENWVDDDNSHEQCMQIILEGDNNEMMSILDRKGYSAIHYAAKKTNFRAIELFKKSYGGAIYIPVSDKFVVNNGLVETAQDALLNAFPEDDEFKSLSPAPSPNDASRLFQLLYAKNEDRFCNIFGRSDDGMAKLLEATNGKSTLLEEACIQKLPKVVKYLLDRSIQKDDLESAKQLATKYAEQGFYEAVNHLLPKLNKTMKNDLLLKTCESNKGDYIMILNELLNDDQVDVNFCDENGNTALYKAQVNSGDGGQAAEIIKGAVVKSILEKIDKKEELQNIPWEILRSFLDSKLTIVSGTSEENFTIKYNLQLSDLDSQKSEPGGFPLPLLAMSKHPEQKLLLDHPLITAYTSIRWRQIQFFFYVDLAFHSIFCLLLSGYILFGYHMQLYEPEISMDVISMVDLNLRALILLLIAIMIIRELIQLLMEPCDFFRNIENYLEFFLIVVTIIVMLKDCGNGLNRESCPQFCALIVLVSWLELMLLIGKLPGCCVEVEMFYSVSVSFLKALRTYIIPIFAFCLSFFALFGSYPCNIEGTDGTESNNTNCSPSGPFRNLGTSFFKSIIMFTGEFNSDDWGIHERYYGTSQIIYLSFVFFIAVVLLNLLTGLAVADTNAISKNAYLLSCIMRIKLISTIDKLCQSRIISVFQRCFQCSDSVSTKWIEVNISDRSVKLEGKKKADWLMNERALEMARSILKKDIGGGQSFHLNSKSIELIERSFQKCLTPQNFNLIEDALQKKLQDSISSMNDLNADKIEAIRQLLNDEKGPTYLINEKALRGIQEILMKEIKNELVDKDTLLACAEQGVSFIDSIMGQNLVNIKINYSSD